MDRKQMIMRLELMKKELAKKQKKLEKANRAARVKAHVKQKIRELNVQASKERDCSSSVDSVSSSTDAVSTQDALPPSPHLHHPVEDVSLATPSPHGVTDLAHYHQQPASLLSQSGQECSGFRDTSVEKHASHADAVLADPSVAVVSPVSSQNKVIMSPAFVCEGGSHCRRGSVAPASSQQTSFSSETNVTLNPFVKPSAPCKNSAKLTHTQEPTVKTFAEKEGQVIFSPTTNKDKPCASFQSDTGANHNFVAMQDIEDSLAITPSFRSMSDTHTDCCLQTLPPVVDRFTDMASSAHTFTLNLDTDGSLDDRELNQRFISNSVIPAAENKHPGRLLSVEPPNLSLEMNTELEANTELETNTELATNTKLEAYTEFEANTELETNTEFEANTELETDTEFEANTELETDTEFEANTELELETNTEHEANTEQKNSTELENRNDTKSGKYGYSADATLQRLERRTAETRPEGTDCSSNSRESHGEKENLAQSTRTVDLSGPVQSFDRSKPVLRLQDIVSAEDAALPILEQRPPIQPFSLHPAQGQFLDYTELDVIPFSQFELTEDFLSESSQRGLDSSQRRSRRKSTSALVQRRSPRLSSFEFGSCEKSASDRQLSQQLGYHYQQSNLFKMVRKQKKSKNALLLSSLFQYLIDEAKRDVSFVEFKLPSDLASLTSTSSKGLLGCNKTASVRSNERVFTESQDIESIPETEIDPDFVSQRICVSENELKLEDDHSTDRHVGKVIMSDKPPSSGNAAGTTDEGTEVKLPSSRPKRKERNGNCQDESPKTLGHVPSCTQPSSPSSGYLQTVIADTISSPVLFGAPSQNNTDTHPIGQTTPQETCDTKQTGTDSDGGAMEEGRLMSVFTPSKTKSRQMCSEAESTKTDRSSGVRFTGCAESGCKDAVVDTVVGTTATASEHTAFVLSLQTTALTLWTLESHQEWSAEFHWYLPQGSTAEGLCRIHTGDEQLAVLVWGNDVDSLSVFLTVFIYHWHSQHTHRFSLPLPSAVAPLRTFCQGLQLSRDTVLVFTTDRVYSKGRKYVVDGDHGALTSQSPMEEVSAQLTDLRPVDQSPDAVLGLSVDQRVLIWNHKSGALIATLPLSDSLPSFARMFTCYSLKGYLLLHMAESEGGRELCLVALNPTTGTSNIIQRFTLQATQTMNWRSCAVYHDVVVSVSQEGGMYVWDACLAKPLLCFHSHPGHIVSATMFGARDSRVLLTGQGTGCLHFYQVSRTW